MLKPNKLLMLAAVLLSIMTAFCGDAQARYMQADPIGITGWTTPDTNPYVYANGNPYRYIDPDGLNGCEPGDDGCGSNPASPKLEGGGGPIGLYATDPKPLLGFRPNSASGQCVAGRSAENLNPYRGPVTEPVIAVDAYGNAIPVQIGQYLRSSPNGAYQQLYGSNQMPTGLRLDRGGHRSLPDPAARVPHAHVPGYTQPNGNPHLPAYPK